MEYNQKVFTPQTHILPNIHYNCRLKIKTAPQDPPQYRLYQINEVGKTVPVTDAATTEANE